MNQGFEEAKERRNWLERLGEKIPGFRGYQDRELRREVDKMQREHFASRMRRLKVAVRDAARGYTDAGQIGVLHQFDRLDRRLDGLSQAVRFADYGHSGLFDVVKFYEEELERLYRFDLSLIDDLDGLEAGIDAVPSPGQGAAAAALETVLASLTALEEKWEQRGSVIAGVVRSGG